MLSPRGARGVQKLNSTTTLIQRTTTEAPRRTYVLHRTGCSQEDDQLLRQGCERSSSPGRKSWSDTLGTSGWNRSWKHLKRSGDQGCGIFLSTDGSYLIRPRALGTSSGRGRSKV